MPSSITFNTGETAKRFIFAAAQDSADDDGESVKLAFGALSTGVSGGTNTEATVSITDDGPPNSAPIFTDGANTTRNFSETVGNAMETIAHSIGSPISATDADNDTLTYSLECQDASRFAVMSTSGQLRTRAGQNYDHEAGPSLSVRVKVNDGNGGSATINVTMSVTDVTTEAPLRPAAPTVLGTSTTSLYVNWNAPNNTGRPAITGYDLRYMISGTWTNGPQNVTATNRAIHGLEPDTSYDVQVRAQNADGQSSWSPSDSGNTRTTEESQRTPTEQTHGLSVPQCRSNGISMYWQVAPDYQSQQNPHGWRVDGRRTSAGVATTLIDFLGPDADVLQTYSDQYWDWTDTTARRGIKYNYRVHALDNNGDLMTNRTGPGERR